MLERVDSKPVMVKLEQVFVLQGTDSQQIWKNDTIALLFSSQRCQLILSCLG